MDVMKTKFLKQLSTLSFLIVVALSATTFGQALDDQKVVDEFDKELKCHIHYEIEITTAKLTRADQKRRFLPKTVDLKPGNAALNYLRASLSFYECLVSMNKSWKLQDKSKWLDCDLKDFPAEEVAARLNEIDSYCRVFRQIEIATKRRDCRWTSDEQDLGFESSNFSEFRWLRQISTFNQLRIRHAIATGDFDKANEFISQGMQMAIHIDQMPCSSAGWDAERIASQTLKSALEISSVDGSPNNLHALQTLPATLVHFEPKYETDCDWLDRRFEFLESPTTSNRTPEQWREVYLNAMDQMEQIWAGFIEDDESKKRKESLEARTGLMLARLYPLAKRELLERGWTEEKVNAMPVGQVVAIQTRFVVDELKRQLYVGRNLPVVEAVKVQQKLQKELASQGYFASSAHGSFPVTDLYCLYEGQLPSVGRNLSRRIVMMQNIERLRDFAAKNSSLPTEQQYFELEMANDPRTGAAFKYKRESDSTCTLQTGTKPLGLRSGYDIDIRMSIKLKQ